MAPIAVITPTFGGSGGSGWRQSKTDGVRTTSDMLAKEKMAKLEDECWEIEQHPNSPGIRQTILDVWKLDGPAQEIVVAPTEEVPVEWTKSFNFSPNMDTRNQGRRVPNATGEESSSAAEVLDRNTSGIGSSELPSDMISIIHYMMQEQKRWDEERRRDEEKREQQRCENKRQRCLDEQWRQDMLTNQFERQMKLIFQHQEGQRITEQEFMKAQ